MPSRMISPDFWTDTAMIQLPMPVRLFYIGTWNFACSAGHLPDDALQIKLKVLPAEQIDAGDFINQLVDAGRMQRITLPDGSKYLTIPAFTKHQKQDARWQSKCAACRQLTETHQTTPKLSVSHQTTPQGGGGGVVGDKGEGEVGPAPWCKKHPGGTDSPCGPCRTARLAYEEHLVTKKREKPTVPEVRREKTCRIHAEYPLPCTRCREDAQEGLS